MLLLRPEYIGIPHSDEVKNATDSPLHGNPIARDRPASRDCRLSTSRGGYWQFQESPRASAMIVVKEVLKQGLFCRGKK